MTEEGSDLDPARHRCDGGSISSHLSSPKTHLRLSSPPGGAGYRTGEARSSTACAQRVRHKPIFHRMHSGGAGVFTVIHSSNLASYSEHREGYLHIFPMSASDAGDDISNSIVVPDEYGTNRVFLGDITERTSCIHIGNIKAPLHVHNTVRAFSNAFLPIAVVQSNRNAPLSPREHIRQDRAGDSIIVAVVVMLQHWEQVYSKSSLLSCVKRSRG